MTLSNRISLISDGELLNAENLNRPVISLADEVQEELTPLPKIGNPLGLSTIKGVLNTQMSAGVISGLIISDNGDGTVAISSGEGLLRASADETSQLYLAEFTGVSSFSIPDADVIYICIDFNSGSPIITSVRDPYTLNGKNIVFVGIVSREGNHLHIIDGTRQNIDSNRKIIRRMLETDTFKWVPGGTILGYTGLNLNLTPGKFWFGLSQIEHGAIDTAQVGLGYDRTFSSYYHNGSWTKDTNLKQIDNLRFNNDGVLKLAKKDRYLVHWIFLFLGSDSATSHISTVYGTDEYKKISDAMASSVPHPLPPVFEGSTVLIGRIIIESEKSIVSVESAFGTTFTSTSPSIHNNLSSIQGGEANEHYHISLDQYNALPDLITKVGGIESQATKNRSDSLNANAEHNHDDRYYTKDEIDYIAQQLTLIGSGNLG